MSKMMEPTDIRRHLVDLGQFFEDARQFLVLVQEADFMYLGYDCSTQLAIRLLRWSRAIELTPRQTYVMEQCVAEAIRRGTNLVKRRLSGCGWSMSASDRDDLAYSTASKALEHLAESHDFCGGPHGRILPNPSIIAFIESNTRFVSRDALENFIYYKRFNSEPKPESSAASGFLLETYIRQQKSLLKKKQGKEREAAENKIAELTARLYGLRSEISLDALDSDDDDHQSVRISSHDQLAMADWGTYDLDDGDDDDVEMPSKHLEFLDYLFQVGDQKMAARDLIPALIQAREYRAVAGLLRVLRDPDRSGEADTLKTLLGNRTLADIRKQILRIKKSDSGEVVQLFDTCKSFLHWEADENDLIDGIAACGVA
ncbi:hypothetical protein HHS34_005735 [Acidithiobacillus montserratensis]|uniref:Uncharacterized protein n=1 Tax=Acidithiobacillus montserratensis TaxID=2729135 RepID=A0ACD5HIM3_9PROT|nr:hypothetical protein [Acidithiobacillus montserratensis]MBU2748633.1 hypothetical protein [Acidithiobacillus montserratensis]